HARERPHHPALIAEGRTLDYGALDAAMDRVASALQSEDVVPGEAIAICAYASIEYGVVFLGALRSGVAVAPLAPSSTPEGLVTMLRDCDAKVLFLDAPAAQALASQPLPGGLRCVRL